MLLLTPICAFLLGRPRPLPPADLRFVLPFENSTFDPAKATTVSDGWLLAALFEGLTRLDPISLEPIPGVARSFDLSEDGRTYSFHLSGESRWSDGAPVTADDFLHAWSRVLAPETGCAFRNLLRDLEPNNALSAPDPLTFVVRLRRPCSYFPSLAAHFCLLPVRRDLVEAHRDSWTRPDHLISNGPYRLALHRIRDRVRLVRNEHYARADQVALGVIDALVVESPNTALNLYLTGAVDWVNGAPPAAVPELRKRPDVRINPVLATNFLRFNVTRPPLDDARVRRAIGLALDRQALCEYVYRSGEVPARALVPPSLPGYAGPDLPEAGPEAARRLLAEAGFPGGEGFPEMELLHAAQDSARNVAQAIADGLRRRLSIRLRPVPQEFKVYIHSTQNLKYQISLGMWIGDYLDPSTFLDLFRSGSGGNRTGWSHSGYDQLLLAAAGSLSSSGRMALLKEAESLLLEQGPIAPICHRGQVNLVSPRVVGFTTNLLDLHPLDQLRTRP